MLNTSFRLVLFITISFSLAALGCSNTCARTAPTTPQTSAALSGQAKPEEKRTKRTDESPPEPLQVVRFEFVLTVDEPGKSKATSRYTLNLADREVGQVHTGTNLPLSPGAKGRIDVGLKIRCNFRPAGDQWLLTTQTELSSTEQPGEIHKLGSMGTTVVSAGSPAVVARFEDPLTQQRYEVTVTGTKLL